MFSSMPNICFSATNVSMPKFPFSVQVLFSMPKLNVTVQTPYNMKYDKLQNKECIVCKVKIQHWFYFEKAVIAVL